MKNYTKSFLLISLIVLFLFICSCRHIEPKKDKPSLLECKDSKIAGAILEVLDCIEEVEKENTDSTAKFSIRRCCFTDINYLSDSESDSVRNCIPKCESKSKE